MECNLFTPELVKVGITLLFYLCVSRQMFISLLFYQGVETYYPHLAYATFPLNFSDRVPRTILSPTRDSRSQKAS